MKQLNSAQGVTTFLLLMVIFGLAIISLIGYQVYQRAMNNKPVSQTPKPVSPQFKPGCHSTKNGGRICY